MQLIVIEAGTDIIAKPRRPERSAWPIKAKPTDHLFKSGQLDKVHEFLEAGSPGGNARGGIHPHAGRGRRSRIQGLGCRLLHDLRLRAEPQREDLKSCSTSAHFP